MLTQFAAAPGVIDLAWGHPDPTLLDPGIVAVAARDALARWGPDALGYGAAHGPEPTLDWLTRHLAALDGRAPEAGELIVVAGASQGLEIACSQLGAPGDAVLVPVPSYHLAIRIFQDHPFRLVPVPADGDGVLPDAAEAAARQVIAEGGRPRFLYLVPVCANPTGVSLPLDRRRAIVEVAERTGLTILEDDVYRELTLDGPPPPSLWSLGAPGSVLRLGSVSKTLAPGVRLGWLTGDRATIGRIARSGLLDSGGGLQHLMALVVTELATSGVYAQNLARIRDGLTARRAALADGLRSHAPETSFRMPEGGYFLWLRLPDGADPRALLPAATAAGVSWIPGDRFAGGTEAGAFHARLAFSRNGPDALAEAAQRIGTLLTSGRSGA